MKKNIIYAVSIMLATLISCGDNDSKNPQQNEVDINKVLTNLVEDEAISEEAKKLLEKPETLNKLLTQIQDEFLNDVLTNEEDDSE